MRRDPGQAVLNVMSNAHLIAVIGGIGPHHYKAYPGEMTSQAVSKCDPDCDIPQYTARCIDLSAFKP